MDALAKLSKKRRLSNICRVGTWIITVLGAAHIISQSYALWQFYRQVVATSGQTFQPYGPLYEIFLSYLPSILGSALLYIFCSIILYTASVVFEALSAPAMESKPAEGLDEVGLDDERVVYTSLKREEILQRKRRD